MNGPPSIINIIEARLDGKFLPIKSSEICGFIAHVMGNHDSSPIVES